MLVVPSSCAMFLLIALSITWSRASLIPINILNYYCPRAPLYVQSVDTASALYHALASDCARIQSPHEIAIIFNGKIILNLIDDHRTIGDIGMNEESNDIQIIRKPVFVVLLEMVADVGNIERIPWFNQATQCLSDPSAKYCHTTLDLGSGIHHDDNGNLVGIDLSHLNLTGTIYLESLPQTVKTLDLSFNNLMTPRFPRLRGKSLEKLNIEHNDHIQLDPKYVKRTFVRNGTSRTLQLSSNQIFPLSTGLRAKHCRIRHWLYHQQIFDVLVLDGQIIQPTNAVPFFTAILNVVDGVTNKELIPWYQPFTDGQTILPDEWRNLGIVPSVYGSRYSRPTKRTYIFDLSGLGLKGRVDLGSLPRAVNELDLSNNNLSSISFFSNGQQCLRELNLQNNDGLRINLAEFNESSISIRRLLISSNQLVVLESARLRQPEVVVKNWLSETTSRKTQVNVVVLDNVALYRGANVNSR